MIFEGDLWRFWMRWLRREMAYWSWRGYCAVGMRSIGANSTKRVENRLKLCYRREWEFLRLCWLRRGLVEVPEETNVHILKWRRIPATCILVDPPSILRSLRETYHESRQVLFQLNWNQSSEPFFHLPKSRFLGQGHASCWIWHIAHLMLGIWCRSILQRNANMEWLAF